LNSNSNKIGNNQNYKLYVAIFSKYGIKKKDKISLIAYKNSFKYLTIKYFNLKKHIPYCTYMKLLN